REGPLLVLTLDRPEKRNALSAALRHALLEALAADKADPDARVVILRGAGDKAFAAGADLEEMAARSTFEQRRFISAPNIFTAVASHPKPVLAALNGHALGAGLELAMACDLRVAAPGAKLGQPEIGLGIIPGGGGTQRLPRLVGVGRASRMVLTGEPIDAATALAWGLVDEVADDPLAKAKEIGRTMAAKSPVALRLAKEALRASEDLPLRESLEREIELFSLAFQSAEAKAGIAAFLTKSR
ncbi:MAG TPA: enoyl-CoA hydratase-related protein, partial [Candidatus Thermoplasmatota archaeon]|nr:enoyl-CoA hydratase-related protein [Candidatus Thermoplasmatota archaeon]